VFLLNAPITAVREVARGMFVISMEAPEIAARSAPASSSTSAGPEFFCGGPSPFIGWQGERIEIVLKAVGKGTSQLVDMRPGEVISCLGPLGHGFDLVAGPRSAVLVSGGLGVAPMPLAAKEASALGMRVTWVHGARSSEELCSESEGDEVIWATDDGSRGVTGTAVAAAPDGDVVLACGPNRMLAKVAARWPQALVAVETYMGCGTGVCLGCAVPLTRGGYDRACKEGPVYRAADIDWTALPSHLPYAVTA